MSDLVALECIGIDNMTSMGCSGRGRRRSCRLIENNSALTSAGVFHVTRVVCDMCLILRAGKLGFLCSLSQRKPELMDDWLW